MSTKKTIFVCEFITAGGFSGEPLPPSLIKEGTLMRDQLCQELLSTDSVEIISLHDTRLTPAVGIAHSVEIDSLQAFNLQFKQALSKASLAWIIAPECDDILLNLTQQAEQAGVTTIGLDVETIALATNKLETAKWLEQQTIQSPATVSAEQWLDQANPLAQAWIAKPLKGVGCEGVKQFGNTALLQQWLMQLPNHMLVDYCVQPYLSRQVASLSMVCNAGVGILLACNQLQMRIEDHEITLESVTVNAMRDHWALFDQLAQTLAAALPSTKGYLGVDVIFDNEAKTLSVIELNPRLTTSYVGLSQVTGQNIAALLVAIENQEMMPPIINQDIFTINL